jgi:hypothetical protein
MEQYYIQYLGEDETSLTPIEPEYELTENDIDNEEGVFYVNGEECLTMPERCNFEDDPQPGDLVFECFDGYALYRPGMNNPTGGEDCIIGTMDEIRGFDQSDWQNESVKPKKVRITEGMIRSIIRESMKAIIRESFEPDPNYTHYAVNRLTGKIVNGWDYSYLEDNPMQDKEYYFFSDLKDMELDPRKYQILKRRALELRGVNPQDWSNWAQN